MYPVMKNNGNILLLVVNNLDPEIEPMSCVSCVGRWVPFHLHHFGIRNNLVRKRNDKVTNELVIK